MGECAVSQMAHNPRYELSLRLAPEKAYLGIQSRLQDLTYTSERTLVAISLTAVHADIDLKDNGALRHTEGYLVARSCTC